MVGETIEKMKKKMIQVELPSVEVEVLTFTFSHSFSQQVFIEHLLRVLDKTHLWIKQMNILALLGLMFF